MSLCGQFSDGLDLLSGFVVGIQAQIIRHDRVSVIGTCATSFFMAADGQN